MEGNLQEIIQPSGAILSSQLNVVHSQETNMTLVPEELLTVTSTASGVHGLSMSVVGTSVPMSVVPVPVPPTAVAVATLPLHLVQTQEHLQAVGQQTLVMAESSQTNVSCVISHQESPKQHIVNKDILLGATPAFWENFLRSPYTDLQLLFQDGSLSVNRAVMAALSDVACLSLEDCHDSIVVPNVTIRMFLDTIALFTTDSIRECGELEEGVLPPGFNTVVDVLQLRTFRSCQDHARDLGAIIDGIRRRAPKLEDGRPKQETDPFAPGYAPGGYAPLVKTEVEEAGAKRFGQADLKKKARDNKKHTDVGSFIDDEDASDEPGDDDEFWGDDEFAPPPNQRQQQRKPAAGGKRTAVTRSKNGNKSDNKLCVDMVIDADFVPGSVQCQDSVISSFLSCHHCHQVGYGSLGEVVSHMETAHQSPQHQLIHCSFCLTPFTSKSACQKHEKEQCKNVENVCVRCGDRLSDRHHLLTHLLKQHKQGEKRRCPHCEKTFLTLVPTTVNRWPHPDQCSKPAVKSSRPKSKSSPGNKKICDDCGGIYRDSWKHKRQCTAINSDIKFTCKACKKGFRRLGAVKKHFKLFNKCKLNDLNQKEYEKLMKYVDNNIKGRTVCQDCGCEYVTRKGPQEHRKNCSAFTQYKCHACNRGMNAMDGFHIHFSKFPKCREAPENAEIVAEILARAQKPEFHVCYLCGAQYKAKESIEKHMLIHSENVEYYHCKEPDCKKKFITQKALEMHYKNHKMPKVICAICGKQVKQGSMQLHMILHTGKKIACPMCGKLFQHKGVLNKHIKTIHDEKKTTRAPKPRRKKPKKQARPQQKQPAVVQAQNLLPIQTIQVQVQPSDEQGVRTPDPLSLELPQDLRGAGQVVTVVSANGSVPVSAAAHPSSIQNYSQNVMIPSVAAHMHPALNTNNIHQLFQMSGQPRYQS